MSRTDAGNNAPSPDVKEAGFPVIPKANLIGGHVHDAGRCRERCCAPALQPLLLCDAGLRGATHISPLPISMTGRLRTDHPDGCTAKSWTKFAGE
jgi:hypothetical protein